MPPAFRAGGPSSSTPSKLARDFCPLTGCPELWERRGLRAGDFRKQHPFLLVRKAQEWKGDVIKVTC
jgi:hypothetical protein